jgi:drug/metabolite transporter (DMT)-like permease
MRASLPHLWQLHIIIFLWGLTPVLGKFISLQALDLVWYRLLFSSISLLVFIVIKQRQLKLILKQPLETILMGIIVGLHWFFFYEAIKVSNVSVALTGFASMTLFASLLQPLLLKKPFYKEDMIYGIIVLIGILIIINADSFYLKGIFYGVLAALTGAIFGVYNGNLIKKQDAVTITFIEFLGAFALITLVKFLFYNETAFLPELSFNDWWALLFLSIVCTTIAFTWSIYILNYFTPFTIIITNNLEPVYGIVLSVILFGQSEHMSAGFYLGAVIILGSVFSYPFVKKSLKHID